MYPLTSKPLPPVSGNYVVVQKGEYNSCYGGFCYSKPANIQSTPQKPFSSENNNLIGSADFGKTQTKSQPEQSLMGPNKIENKYKKSEQEDNRYMKKSYNHKHTCLDRYKK